MLCNSTVQREALIKLYNATNGPGWANHANWTSQAALNYWAGIACTNGLVTSLTLDSLATGTVPAFKGLESLLAIDYCAYSDCVPFGGAPIVSSLAAFHSFVDVPSLVYLSLYLANGIRLPALPASLTFVDVRGCGLSAQTLPRLSALKLTTLMLAGNLLNSMPPVKHMSGLMHLDVGRCGLFALADISGLPLQTLIVADNQLTVLEVETLPSLQYLDARSNQIRQQVVGLQLLTQLTFLDLSFNLLTVAPTLSMMPRLQTAALSGNAFAPWSGDFSANVALGLLALASCNLSELGPLARSQNLSYLDLSGNTLTQLPDLCGPMPLLEYVDLRFNALARLPTLPASVQYLYLEGNPLRDVASLRGLSALQILTMSNALVEGRVDFAASSGSLDRVTMTNCGLTEMPLFGASQTIQMLDLSYNQISSCDELGYLTNLRYTSLAHNQLRSIPSLAAWSGCASVDFSYNFLAELATLPDSCQTIAVSFNRLTWLPRLPASGVDLWINNNATAALSSGSGSRLSQLDKHQCCLRAMVRDRLGCELQRTERQGSLVLERAASAAAAKCRRQCAHALGLVAVAQASQLS
jgi:Leucine-rich repeat (LRR) protein